MRRRRPTVRVDAQGFTFVEILAALLFLAISIPAIVTALTVANRAATIAERTSAASDLAQNKLNELVIEQTWTSGGNRGDFGQDHPGFTWEIIQDNWEYGDMVQLTCEVSFQVQGQDRSVQLATLVSPNTTTP
jgi:Tfp pilus assembly protein PilV